MYTYNLFVFGHDLSKNPQLNNDLYDYDFQFSQKINGKTWEVDFPYHGGVGDIQPCVFGICISDSDQNKNFIKEIRSAKEEDYINDYKIFLDNFFKQYEVDFEESPELFEELKKFIQENEPEFYSVEVSS